MVLKTAPPNTHFNTISQDSFFRSAHAEVSISTYSDQTKNVEIYSESCSISCSTSTGEISRDSEESSVRGITSEFVEENPVNELNDGNKQRNFYNASLFKTMGDFG